MEARKRMLPPEFCAIICLSGGLAGRSGVKGMGVGGLPSSSLRGEEGASRVDVQLASPFRGRHIYSVRTPHDTGEAA